MRALVGLAFAAGIALALPGRALAGDVSSEELLDRSRDYDGRVIEFRGEAIQEPMVRGAHAWLHLNDDPYSLKVIEEGAPPSGFNSGIAVWAPVALARKVGGFGGYRRRGDIVRVTGTFYAACAEHGGDMDIHARSLEVVARGAVVPHELHREKAAAAAVLAIVVLALAVADRRLSARERVGMDGRWRAG